MNLICKYFCSIVSFCPAGRMISDWLSHHLVMLKIHIITLQAIINYAPLRYKLSKSSRSLLVHRNSLVTTNWQVGSGIWRMGMGVDRDFRAWKALCNERPSEGHVGGGLGSKGRCHGAVVPDNPVVETGKAEEPLQLLVVLWHSPGGDGRNLSWIYLKAPFSCNVSGRK